MSTIIGLDGYHYPTAGDQEIMSVEYIEKAFSRVHKMVYANRNVLVAAARNKFDILEYQIPINYRNILESWLTKLKVAVFPKSFDLDLLRSKLTFLENMLLSQLVWCDKFNTIVKAKYGNTAGFIAFNGAHGSILNEDNVLALISLLRDIRKDLSFKILAAKEDFNKLFNLED